MKALIREILSDRTDSLIAAIAGGVLLAYGAMLIVNAFGCACLK